MGFDDAIATAIKTASHSLRHITGADVKHMTVAADEGAITEYRVDLKLAFALDPDDEDDD
ncbi:MAG: dodecin family protein [Chloroflexota bacterium]